MSKIFVANWKMYVRSEAEAVSLAKKSDEKNVIICPPHPFLATARKILKHASLGSQDMFWENSAVFTGAVSPEMLKKLGVTHVIIGHSERRKVFFETDEMVNKKMYAAIAAGIMPILCVGEPKEIRKKGVKAAIRFVEKQLEKDLDKVRTDAMMVAYEPIWAIGTGKTDDPKDSVQVAEFIKLFATEYGIHAKVLYGGSVTGKNVKRILSYRDLDGVLVGGASVKSNEIKQIIRTL